MSFSRLDSKTSAAAGSTSVTFDATAATGDLLVLCIGLGSAEDLTGLTVPAGYSYSASYEANLRTVAVYHKESDGSETGATISHSDETQQLRLCAMRYSKDGALDAVAFSVGVATNDTSVSTNPVSTASGALLIGIARKNGTLQTSIGFSTGFSAIFGASGLVTENNLIWPVEKISTGPSDSLTHTLSSSTTRQSAVLVSFTEATVGGPSITTADNITTEGQIATFTLSGNSAAPVSATLNGTDVGTLTDQGSGVYSYTAPLIADDAAATLSVSVDATTVDATISYANSLPYALTVHAEPDSNSVMFGNQFATTGAVELAEPALVSGAAGAATIDWAAMDSAQGWTADINTYATANEDGTQTWEFTYLIAETNQTGTFQRTFTVGDGVVVVTGGGRRVGVRPSIRSAVRAAISSAIHEG